MPEIPRHDDETSQEGNFKISDWDKKYLETQRERLQSETMPKETEEKELKTARARNAIIKKTQKKEKAE